MEDNTFGMIVSLGICVVMPVMIVWLTSRAKSHAEDRRTEVLLKAIENGLDIDPDLLVGPGKAAKPKTVRMRLLEQLKSGTMMAVSGIVMMVCSLTVARLGWWLTLCGGFMMAIGAGMIVYYIMGRKDLQSEIRSEEEKKKEPASVDSASEE